MTQEDVNETAIANDTQHEDDKEDDRNDVSLWSLFLEEKIFLLVITSIRLIKYEHISGPSHRHQV